MIRKGFLLITLISLILNSAMLPRPTASAQATEDEACSEERLRDLGVAIVGCSETSSFSCGDGSLNGDENAERVFNFFTSKGYKPWQAAGIVGNMKYESGVLPQRLQGQPADKAVPAETLTDTQLNDGTLGWGIVQFTPPGKYITTFPNRADANSLEAQINFVWNQLEGNPPLSEKRAGDEIKGTTNVEEAVKAFQGTSQAGGQYFGYERPKDQSGSVLERTTYAKDALAQFGSGTGVSGNGSGCELDASGCPQQPVSITATVNVSNIRVHGCIAGELERIMKLAAEQSIPLSGSGWVTKELQERKRANNGCGGSNIYNEGCRGNPVTAIPGTSRHEFGTAIDFTCGGVLMSGNDICFAFLVANTQLENLEEESWHWSVDGG